MAALLGAELRTVPGLDVLDAGFDGRSDIVVFTVEKGAERAALGTTLAEDVFVQAGRTLRSEGDRADWIAGRIWRPQPVRRALATHALMTGMSGGSRTTFRVIVRVLQERSFLRTDLRRALTTAIRRQHPEWRLADPAELEVWIVEYGAGRLLAGLRASGPAMRRHGGRTVERRGALRPTLAAAMVRLAGSPRGLLLDPCCGSGTILEEALRAGWEAQGVDIDEQAVGTARRNAGGASVERGDARRLPFAESSMASCVSNLPFGRQYGVQGEMEEWLRDVLAQMARVTAPGGRLVLLAPAIPRAVVPAGLHLANRLPIRLLGAKTSLWVFDRRSDEIPSRRHAEGAGAPSKRRS